MDDNNGKGIIPEDSDKKHYYYEYSIPRQLIYSRPRIFILGLGGFLLLPWLWIYIFSWQWLSERNQGLFF